MKFHIRFIVITVVLALSLMAGIIMPRASSATSVSAIATAPVKPVLRNQTHEPIQSCTSKSRDNFYQGVLYNCIMSGNSRAYCKSVADNLKVENIWQTWGIK